MLSVGFFAGSHWKLTETDTSKKGFEIFETDAPHDEAKLAKNNSSHTAIKSTQESKAHTAPITTGNSSSYHANHQYSESVYDFDKVKLANMQQKMYSKIPSEKQQALLILAQLGSEELMPELVRVAADEAENSELRRELIRQINWTEHSGELASIVKNSKDAETRLAAVIAVNREKLSTADIMKLENVLLENLHIEAQDGIKIATLNYFLGQSFDVFQQIVKTYSNELSSHEVRNYIDSVSRVPN